MSKKEIKMTEGKRCTDCIHYYVCQLLNELNIGKSIDKFNKKGFYDLKIQKDSKIQYSFNLPKISIKEINLTNQSLEELTKINFHFKKPGKIIETLENLGLPPNLENPKSFSIVLEKIYQEVTNEIYKISMK